MFGHKLFSVEARNKHCSISCKSSLGGGCSQWWHSQFVPCWRKQPGVLGAGASPPGGTSIAAQAHPKPLVSAPCSCTRFGFSQNLWLWAWGVGFPVSCNMEGFLCLDFFTGYYVFCADCCLHSLFFLFFSGTTQEGSHCKRGGSLMGGMVLWPVCSQTKK